MANRIVKQGRKKRAGHTVIKGLGNRKPDGRAKGGSHRIGRTGIKKPGFNASKRGKQSAPMFNAMRGSPTIMKTINRDSAGRSLGRPKSKTSRKDPPKVLDKMYNAMRGS